MLIARWHITAKFGHKQDVIQSLRKWAEDIGKQVGWGPDEFRMITGSVGAGESVIENEVRVENLGKLEAAFEKLGNIPEHARWSRDLEAHIVSGSNYWTVYRVLH